MRTGRILAALLSGAALSAPPAAFAQQTSAPPSMPTYARPYAPNGEETIHGRIDRFNGKYHIDVRDDRGFIDSVELHQGTVINPTGLALQPGMPVTIRGYNRGSTFAANEIDAPYPYGRVRTAYPYTIGVGIGPVNGNFWH